MKLNIIKTEAVDNKTDAFVIENNVLYECNATGTVIVPEGITIIGSNVFANKSNVTKVVLPEGLKTIETNAFLRCANLKEINIPESVEVIEAQAFLGCEMLKKVHLPKNLKRLGVEAFTDSGLESVDLPEHPEYVGTCTFGSSKLNQVTIPANFPLTLAMFRDCEDLETVTFEGTDIKVPEICFQHCRSLKGINLNVIKTVGESGFSNCIALDFDVFPKDIRVKDKAFSECGIKHITIEDLNSIERAKGVFFGCCQLTEAVIKIREPMDTEEIPDKLFSHCNNLEKVSFIGLTDKIKSIGQGAFGYTALKEFEVPESVTKISNYAFFNTKQLTEIILPKKLRTIGKKAFSESGLKNITLPDSVKIAKAECFSDCYNLEEVTLPAKEFEISDGMFMSCVALKRVNNADKIVQLGKYAFYGANSLKQIDLSSAADIGGGAFKCSGLTSVKLSKYCTTLGMNAFCKCRELKLADLSESSIEYFAPYIFYRCGGNKLMTEVILPDKFWNIGARAFTRCSIKDLAISGQNVMIDENAFADAKIDTLTFADNPDSRVYINKKAFKDAFIGELTIPDYLYNEYKNIWDNIK